MPPISYLLLGHVTYSHDAFIVRALMIFRRSQSAKIFPVLQSRLVQVKRDIDLEPEPEGGSSPLYERRDLINHTKHAISC